MPGLAWWPGKISANSTCSEVASVLDIMPTATKLAGGMIPDDRSIDGRDIRPLLFQSGKAESKPFFYCGHGGNKIFAVRKGKWKLHIKIYSQLHRNYGWPNVSRKNPLLFDLEADPSEKYNRRKGNQLVVSELLNEIDNFQRELKREGTFWR